MKHDQETLTREREAAWVGDAVLSLYVREWILRLDGGLDGEKFTRFTSNDFLRCVGNPTRVEAEIGEIYRRDGLAAAFTMIEERLLPLFERQERTRQRRRG